MQSYKLFDADHHWYEPRDCITRYIEPRHRATAVQARVLADGREAMFAGGREITYVAVNMYEKVGRPGTLVELLRSFKSGGNGETSYEWDDIKPVYTDRTARLKYLDEQEVESILLFPSIAIVAEAYIQEPEALYANIHAYNRFIDEEWGFAHQNRLYGVAMLSLKDLDRAVEELDWVLARGARVISLRPGPAYGRTIGDPYFDPFWSRANEAGLSVALHLADSGYNEMVATHWGWQPSPPNFQMSAWQWMHCDGDRPIMETLSAMVYDNLFGRFPRLKAISVENGAEWLPYFLRRLDKMRGMGRGGPWIGGPLKEHPSQIVKRHILVTPYPEDDIIKLAETVGTESLVFGSDWPHAEGMTEPSAYRDKVKSLSHVDQERILRTNGLRIVGRA